MLYKKLPGFTLIELAIVLVIIGVLAGAVFKGLDVLESAKIRSTLNDIHRIRTVAALYRDMFGQWPGNDSLAKDRFGTGVKNGSGTGVITGHEGNQFWVHLAKAGYLSENMVPASKLGGTFLVEGNGETRQNFLILAGPEKSGILTPKQAAALKASSEDGGPSSGLIRVREGQGHNPGSCVRGSAFNLETKEPACILVVELK